MGILKSTVAKGASLLVVIRPEELLVVLQAASAFFLLLAAYFLLLPLRDEAGLSLGSDALPALFTGSLLVTLAAAPVASSLLSSPELSKGRALMLLYRFFAVSLVGFYALYAIIPQPTAADGLLEGGRGVSGASTTFTGWASSSLRACFYLWISLLNLFVCSAMWARLADLFSPEAASRLYGYIGAGATLGQLAGSILAATFSNHGPKVLLLSGLLLELAARCSLTLGEHTSQQHPLRHSSVGPVSIRSSNDEPSPRLKKTAETEAFLKGSPDSKPGVLLRSNLSTERDLGMTKPTYSFWEGLLLIWASPYLLHVCVFLLLTAINSSFFYFERVNVIASYVSDPMPRRVLFAKINSVSAVAILLGQLLLTGRVLTSLGTEAALCAGPAVSLIGMLAIAVQPSPGVVAISEAFRKVLNYVVLRPGREVLFTVICREEKYKAKVCIDTLVQRLGDATAAGVFELLGSVYKLGPAGVAVGASPFCILWLAAGFSLGRRHAKLAKNGAIFDNASLRRDPG